MVISERIVSAFGEFRKRSTTQRQTMIRVLVALSEEGKSFTAEEVLEDLHKAAPGIGRATVFRTIDKLVQRKVLDHIDFADGDRRYRFCESEQHHYHLTCRQCHRVVEVDLCLPQAKLDALGK